MARQINSLGTVAGLILGLLVVAGVAWLLWTQSTTKQQQTTQTPNSSNTNVQLSQNYITIDKTELPAGWQMGGEDTKSLSLSSGGMGATPTENCFAEGVRVDDVRAKASQASEFITTLTQEYVTNIRDNKGYASAELGPQQLMISVDGTQKPVAAKRFKLTSPGDNPTYMYQTKGYIVGDGWYVGLTGSCAGNEFSRPETVLQMMKVRT